MPPQDPHAGPSDAELVERCLAGDDSAFEILFHRYRDAVYGYAARMLRSLAEADEAAVEILERVFGQLHRFRSGEEFRPWLYGISRNECLMRLRRSRKRIQLEIARFVSGQAAGPAESVEQDERGRVLRAKLDELEEPYRETIVLAYYQGLSSREIAATMDTNENTVRTRVARGLRMLRERMDRESGGERRS